jgi:hypothetical protein
MALNRSLAGRFSVLRTTKGVRADVSFSIHFLRCPLSGFATGFAVVVRFYINSKFLFTLINLSAIIRFAGSLSG